MSSPTTAGRLTRPALVILVGGAMFTFISYWRTAAVVLCDLASSAFYIGGIVEQAIGPAAPFFILAVLLFSYAVRAVYIESSTLFVRGGVYRVVREALGRFFAKIAVSALMFDYLLTGPISGVSAGQYLLGLVLQCVQTMNPELLGPLGLVSPADQDAFRRWGSVIIACLITVYFYWQNLVGILASSDKAVKIMIATTVMAVVMLTWALITLAVRGPANPLVMMPDLSAKVEYREVEQPDRITGELESAWERDPRTGEFVPKLGPDGQPLPQIDPITGEQVDPLGFIPRLFPALAEQLRHPGSWLSLIGLLGLAIAFGHSILAMSGEETLAQVYREVESPKLPNFKKAGFIIFVYSLLLTGGTAFLAVLLIPDEVRMRDYSDNLISGLTMYLIGPESLRLVLSGFVVVVGAFILAGAVNTAIIGSNGVLNRVAEDGVLPEWFLKPHPRYGTTHRVLGLIAILQLAIIVISGGNMLLLGEAYAFGVVWSFVFQSVSMVVLRFKDPRPREFKVPLNFRLGRYEVPVGLLLILLILLTTASVNLLTKEVATISGLTFTALFFTGFTVSERLHRQRLQGPREHLEQFNQETTAEISPAGLNLTRPYRRMVAIRIVQNLPVLEKALAETDAETTDLIVLTAKIVPDGDHPQPGPALNRFDQEFLTAVVQLGEKAGKPVKPVIVPTNNPVDCIARMAAVLQVHELWQGLSRKFSPSEQAALFTFAWRTLQGGRQAPLTVRIVARDADVHLDLDGGNRIPSHTEHKARTAAELRAAGAGVRRVLLLHDGSPAGSELCLAVLTLLDPHVVLALATPEALAQTTALQQDLEQAQKLGRVVQVHSLADTELAPALARLAREEKMDLVIAAAAPHLDATILLSQAPCRVFVAGAPPAPG